MITKAVIPAAGLGTRFLPATKAQPKEMLPVVDRPAIQYAVEEAVAAGARDVCIVTSSAKHALEDHFDRAPELEELLERKGKVAELEVVRALTELADVHAVRQHEPLGLGHAVGAARHHVGDQPFVNLLPDDVMVDGGDLLRRMVAAHEEHGGILLALLPVAPEEISAYGSAAVEPVGEGLMRVDGVVEKPAPEDAPSELAVVGRYVLPPEIFDAIDHVGPGAGGEIQLTDAIGALIGELPVHGCVFTEGRYDVGQKQDYLRATVEVALARDDVGPGFRAFLSELAAREGL